MPAWLDAKFFGAVLLLASSISAQFGINLGDQTAWVNAIMSALGVVSTGIGLVKGIKKVE